MWSDGQMDSHPPRARPAPLCVPPHPSWITPDLPPTQGLLRAPAAHVIPPPSVQPVLPGGTLVTPFHGVGETLQRPRRGVFGTRKGHVTSPRPPLPPGGRPGSPRFAKETQGQVRVSLYLADGGWLLGFLGS